MASHFLFLVLQQPAVKPFIPSVLIRHASILKVRFVMFKNALIINGVCLNKGQIVIGYTAMQRSCLSASLQAYVYIFYGPEISPAPSRRFFL